MKVIGICDALELVRKDPGALGHYDYIIDENAWLIPVEHFLGWLRRNRPATAKALGVKV